MYINRKPSTVYINLALGSIFLLVLLYTSIYEDGGFKLHYFILIFIELYYFGLALYNWKTPLIYLGENTITFYSFPNKKTSVQPNQVSVEYTAGDYIFTIDNKESYRIVKTQIPTDQLEFFESYIKSLTEKALGNNNSVTGLKRKVFKRGE